QRMMVQATQHVPEARYYRYLEGAGATAFSQGTGNDSTSFYATIPSNALELVMWLWSDQMGFFVPRVDQHLLDQQRDVVRNERHETLENPAYGRLYEIARGALYPPDHPYHRLALSLALDHVTVDDVKTFFDRHYAPSGAVLVLSGDFTQATAMAMI